MNIEALLAVFAFAAALMVIFGILYMGASRSYSRGEMGIGGVKLLRWAVAGYLVIFVLLAVTAFLT